MRRTQHHLCSILVGNIQSESNQQEIPDNPKTRHVVLKKKRVVVVRVMQSAKMSVSLKTKAMKTFQVKRI